MQCETHAYMLGGRHGRVRPCLPNGWNRCIRSRPTLSPQLVRSSQSRPQRPRLELERLELLWDLQVLIAAPASGLGSLHAIVGVLPFVMYYPVLDSLEQAYAWELAPVLEGHPGCYGLPFLQYHE